MKGREGKGPPSADLLVCFPSRAHLTLMAPKPICSPSRPSEASTRHHRRRSHRHHNLRNTSNRGGHASPQLWAKNKQADISEPTSPKVTCAGQIKVRPKKGSCKSWQSVMEEIERLHNKNKKKKHSWGEAFGLKKDVMGFLTCLRNVRFDFRCFSGFPNVEVTSDDEEDEEEDDNEDEEENDQSESSKAFSKWFMILQESNEIKTGEVNTKKVDDDVDDDHVAPPKNALLLMRCRSAPAKSWLEEKEEEEEKSDCEEKENEELMKRKLEAERLVVMRCGADFSKFSCDIAKETWVVGGIKDMLSRSRSSKR